MGTIDLELEALLATVARLLEERGDNPEVVSRGDMISIAVQHVQLSMVLGHELREVQSDLAKALGATSEVPLGELVATTSVILKRETP